jgi:DNA (cytosine-5)-methyltransferase 1
LVSKKFKPFFLEWDAYLRGLGYSNFSQVLNAKHYGIPQNRERVFMVSILGEGEYQFPQQFPLEIRLKDVLEQNVEEKYYLSDKLVNYVFSNGGVNKDIQGGVNVSNG